MRRLAAVLLALAACSDPPPEAPVATSWLGMMTCKHESYVYAVGKGSSGFLGRKSAEGRARTNLLGKALPTDGAKVALREAEVLDTHSEANATHALARTTDPSIDRSSLPECAPAPLAWRGAPAAGCPAWTQRTSWIEGGKRHAVGVAAGIQNPSLAASTAENRARSELVKLASVEIGGSSSSSSGDAPGAQIVEQVECGGAFYAHVVL